MDDIGKRLAQSLIEVHAEEIASEKVTRDQMEEARRNAMDPSEFGGFDDADDEFQMEDPPEFEIKDKDTSSESVEGSDIINDHVHIRSYNYALSDLYSKLIPKLLREFYATANPRFMSSINEAVEQVRKIHTDMLNSSKIIEETKGKRKIVKAMDKVGDRFPEEGSEDQQQDQTIGASRIDRMAMLTAMLQEEKISMGIVPDWAFDKVACGEDVRKVVIEVKHTVEQPKEKEINPNDGSIEGEAEEVNNG